MTLEEIEKKAEEYAEACRTERERKLYEESQQWGMESLSASDRYVVSEDITKRFARIEGYIAGATEICSYCNMSFKETLKEKPTEAGRYLVVRNKYGVKWTEVLMFDGKFWVMGPCDEASSIEKWCKLEA